jgi:hypothetical protein
LKISYLNISKPFISNKTKLANHLTQQPFTELVVSLIVNHEKYLLRSLADTGASSSCIIEAYTLATFPFIKADDSDSTTCSKKGGKFTLYKLGYACDLFAHRVQSQKQICTSWEFHVDDHPESSSTHDMIFVRERDLLGESSINRHFND